MSILTPPMPSAELTSRTPAIFAQAARQRRNVLPQRRGLRPIKAVVDGESKGKLNLKFGGSSAVATGVAKLADFMVAPGEMVWCIDIDGDVIAIGPTAKGTAPMCKMRRSTNLGISNASDWRVAGMVVDYDYANMAMTNGDGIHMRHDGIYLCHWNVRWANAASGQRYCAIFAEGDGGRRICSDGGPGSTPVTLSCSAIYDRTNDAVRNIQPFVYQDSGGILSILADFTWSIMLSAVWIAPGLY